MGGKNGGGEGEGCTETVLNLGVSREPETYQLKFCRIEKSLKFDHVESNG